jgi:hypothetical protein
MIYFGLRQDVSEVEKILGNEYFKQHFQKRGDRHWESLANIGTCRKSFALFESVPIEFPGSEKANSIIRVYGTDLEKMLEGARANEEVEKAEDQYPKHQINVVQEGPLVKVIAVPPCAAAIEQREKGTEIYSSWPVDTTEFGKLLKELWGDDGLVFYDDSGKLRQEDIHFIIIGGEAPEGYEPKSRQAVTRTAYDLFEPPIRMGRRKGGNVIVGGMQPEGVYVEHSEDGQVIGEVDTTSGDGTWGTEDPIC